MKMGTVSSASAGHPMALAICVTFWSNNVIYLQSVTCCISQRSFILISLKQITPHNVPLWLAGDILDIRAKVLDWRSAQPIVGKKPLNVRIFLPAGDDLTYQKPASRYEHRGSTGMLRHRAVPRPEALRYGRRSKPLSCSRRTSKPRSQIGRNHANLVQEAVAMDGKEGGCPWMVCYLMTNHSRIVFPKTIRCHRIQQICLQTQESEVW